MAQRPPTGGSAPIESEDKGINPVVFIVGGIAIGAASYAIVKSKGAKIPVSAYLPDYLLAHNILPTSDALNLMYKLNPSLNNQQEIPKKSKLKLPEFPVLNEEIRPDLITGDEVALATDLNREMDQFVTLKESLEKLEAAGNMASVQVITNQVNQQLSTAGWKDLTSRAIFDQMVYDLLRVFNQTLDEVVLAKSADQEQLMLMKSISDNLSELFNDVRTLSLNHDFPVDLNKNLIFLASAEEVSVRRVKVYNSMEASSAREGISKDFAFAVYKINEAGELITKGPEVEGKYKVKYVLPALKDIPSAYHTLRDPATYAVAALPPAKMYIIVEDFSGIPVSIQDPLIDFKVVFKNPQLINEDEMIIVPLYLSND
ncbi:hypothetical protein [Echinicola sp. 20G]|uniref:hypothetical protein n=1 Tax=Echinicola sp. 20G TaxID=2781961 RepID=UPI00191036C1|nr:hypothetical protein [Echinicola sp. 20G]